MVIRLLTLILLDCKIVGFAFCGLKIGFSVAKASHTRDGLSPVSLSLFSLASDLLFDCSRVLEYPKIQTALQSMIVWRFENVGFRREGEIGVPGENPLLNKESSVIRVLGQGPGE